MVVSDAIARDSIIRLVDGELRILRRDMSSIAQNRRDGRTSKLGDVAAQQTEDELSKWEQILAYAKARL